MRRFALVAVAGAMLLAAAPVASASTPRADSYFEVWCLDGDHNLVQAESVDAHAILQGHKDDAVAAFGDHFPFGWACWVVGPFNT